MAELSTGDSRPLPRNPAETRNAGRRQRQAERLRLLLSWRRFGRGLHYLRRHGVTATLRRVFPSQQTYQNWIRDFDTLTRKDAALITQHIGDMKDRPLISLLIPVTASEANLLRSSLDPVVAQLYPNWEICLAAAPEAVAEVARIIAFYRDDRIKLACTSAGPFGTRANAALAAASGRFVVLIQTGDALAPHALYMVAAELQEHPEAALVYSDEDAIGLDGRRFAPRFKSDWNPDLLLGCDMVGRLASYRRDLVERVGGWRDLFGAEEHDLALRTGTAVGAEQIRHIAMVLYHRHSNAMDGGAAAAEEAGAACRAVRDHLARIGSAAAALPLASGRVRIRYPLPEPPPGVSLIVPTRDQLATLHRCIDGLRHATDYPSLDIMIVDNGSCLAETHAYFAELAGDPRVRVLSCPGPFNYSALNNAAVAESRYDIIGLINNDIKIIHPRWLCEMVAHALRPEIGAVGAKLYYPDDTVQHAGTILGLYGTAGHGFRGFARSNAGYCDRLALAQNLSAVTAACMVLRKSAFLEVGGFDEVNLAIAFNDVDLCLRLREKGYRIVWTAFAELYHWESETRGSDLRRDQIARFRRETAYLQRRWPAVIARDPYYNPNLTIEREDFGLAFPPRTSPPWRPAAADAKPSNRRPAPLGDGQRPD